jgi:hypothetical protein
MPLWFLSEAQALTTKSNFLLMAILGCRVTEARSRGHRWIAKLSKMTERDLPPEIAKGAHLAGNELGWRVMSFPDALSNAEALAYACIGGQFQFRLEVGICEMYCLSADSESRKESESWQAYCARSCSEVRRGFDKLLSETDFSKQALEWPLINKAVNDGLDPMEKLVFVAYFVDEAEWLEDQRRLL